MDRRRRRRDALERGREAACVVEQLRDGEAAEDAAARRLAVGGAPHPLPRVVEQRAARLDEEGDVLASTWVHYGGG